MNRYVSRSLLLAGLVGGFWAAGTGIANASETPAEDDASAIVNVELPLTLSGQAVSATGESTQDEPAPVTAPSVSIDLNAVTGVLSGQQAVASVSAPVTVAGNAVSVLGDASSTDSSVSSTQAPAGAAGTTDAVGVLSGIQGVVDVAAPVTVSGNAVSVFGDATTDGSSVSTANAGGSGDGGASNSGVGVGSGLQAPVDVLAPVTASGNAFSVFGDAESQDSTVTATDAAGVTSGGGGVSNSGTGLNSGWQIPADVTMPLTASGNAGSVFDDATSNGSSVTVTDQSGVSNSGGKVSNSGIGKDTGWQIPADVTAPVTFSGNAISGTGEAVTTGSDVEVVDQAGVANSGGEVTNGGIGWGVGWQIPADVTAPVTASGSAVSGLGDARTSDSDVSIVDRAGVANGGGEVGNAGYGVASGWQIPADVTAPVTVSGNAGSVLGDAGTSGSDVGIVDNAGVANGNGEIGNVGYGLGSGWQIPADVTAPVTVSGNAISGTCDAVTTGSDVTVVDNAGVADGSGDISNAGYGVGTGWQIPADVTAPVTVSGNAGSLLDNATSTGSDVAIVDNGGVADGGSEIGNAGFGLNSGWQIPADVTAPVTFSGNAVSGAGEAVSTGSGVGIVDDASVADGSGEISNVGVGKDSGWQIVTDWTTPVTASGNAFSGTGDAVTAGSDVGIVDHGDAVDGSGEVSNTGIGWGVGWQVLGDVTAPVTASGNAGSVFGDAGTAGSDVAIADNAGVVDGSGDVSNAGYGVGSGWQVLGDVTMPWTFSGNAISGTGDAVAEWSEVTVTDDAAVIDGDGDVSNTGIGLNSGWQVVTDWTTPATASGNAISGVGDARTAGSDVSVVDEAGVIDGDGQISNIGIGKDSGWQIAGDVTAPVTLSGNAGSLAGDADAVDSDVTVVDETSVIGHDGQASNSGIGFGTGWQVVGDVVAPVTGSGNAASVLGGAESDDSDVDVITEDGSIVSGDADSSGVGVASGWQVVGGIVAPVTAAGNAATIAGEAESDDSSVTVHGADGYGDLENEGVGVGSGWQPVVGITTPVTVSGNAVSPIGAESDDSTVIIEPVTP